MARKLAPRREKAREREMDGQLRLLKGKLKRVLGPKAAEEEGVDEYM